MENIIWILLIVLLCPLMHLLMMKKHKHGDSPYRCLECGLLNPVIAATFDEKVFI